VSAAQARVGAGRLELRGRAALQCYPLDAAWAPDGSQLAVAGGEGEVLLLPWAGPGSAGPARADPVAMLIGRHAGGALAVAWQNGGKLFASSGQDGAVLLWDAQTRQSRRLHTSSEWSEHLAFAPNGRLLAVATGRRLHIFQSDGTLRHSIDTHAGVIAALAWRPKSSEIAAVGNGGARIHRLEPQLQTREYAWPGACLSASWSPDGRVLASGLQVGSVHVLFPASATQSEMKGYGAKVALTGWSGNGRYLGTAAGEALVIWDVGKSARAAESIALRAHTARISEFAFRPTGTWLASAARDLRLLLWRAGQSTEPQDAHLLGAESTLLRWSPDGRYLAVGDAQGTLSIFEFTS